jgi:hypothetical protein
MKGAVMTMRLRQSWIVAALTLYGLARLAPPLTDLTPQGQAVLGTVAAGAILWITEATPIMAFLRRVGVSAGQPQDGDISV